MKKIFLTIAFAIFTIGIAAQKTLAYKPLASFGTDTTAFLIYNFMDRAESYKGKTIKEVSKNMQIPINYIIYSLNFRTGNVDGIFICIYSNKYESYLRDNKKETNSIYVEWEEQIEDEDKVIDISRKNRGNYTALYEHFKDCKIKKVSVVIPNYSKYYEKYKEKETKSTKYEFKEAPMEGKFTPVPWPYTD